MPRVIGFPDAASAVPLQVRITRSADTEIWERCFGGQCFASRLTRRDNHIVEHFGILAFAFDLAAIPHGHALRLQRWWCGRLPLPLALAPRISASETDDCGRFAFAVRIGLPLFGLLVAYRGSLIVPAKAIDPAEWSLAAEHDPVRRQHAG